MGIIVFRYGHRLERDKRVTTHCGLVARAFGAKKIIYTGQEDTSVENTIKGVIERFGGNFKVEYVRNWRKALEQLKEKSLLVHLTMYGLNLNDFLKKLKTVKKTYNDIVLIIGSQKVPKEIYEYADFNISVTNQPHSEIAALAIVLDRLNPKYLDRDFEEKQFKGGKLKIIPTNKGKIIKDRAKD